MNIETACSNLMLLAPAVPAATCPPLAKREISRPLLRTVRKEGTQRLRQSCTRSNQLSPSSNRERRPRKRSAPPRSTSRSRSVPQGAKAGRSLFVERQTSKTSVGTQSPWERVWRQVPSAACRSPSLSARRDRCTRKLPALKTPAEDLRCTFPGSGTASRPWSQRPKRLRARSKPPSRSSSSCTGSLVVRRSSRSTWTTASPFASRRKHPQA
mmetsp:Transcript_18304/g.69345  ORF Transcript_18304/g.69345 Transcript_18304/m.69345 type:complete len:212 (+) Transcript_18304:1294-1929(+)